MSPKEPEEVRDWYDALSARYDEVYGDEQDKKHQRVIESLDEREFESFVDVGCGTGKLLEIVSTKSRFALGIDLSRQMLRKARQRITDGSVQFLRAEASHLPLRDQVADGVVSISVSEHGPLFAKQLRELSRIATEGAVLSLTVFSDKNRTDHEHLMGKTMELVESLSVREQLWTRRPNPR